jgi:hypothetical protein
VFSGSIPVLMVLAGQWAWDCKSSFVRWAWALWTVNPNGVSGSIPLMNESETERKKMQVKRDENPILGLFPKSGGSRLPVPRGGRLRFESFSIG